MKYLILQIALVVPILMLCCILNAQPTLSLRGKVSDGKGTLVAAGDVQLLSAKDSSLLKYAVVVDGKFEFTQIQQGTYFLKFNCLGFTEAVYEISLDRDRDLDINLVSHSSVMDKVTVSSTRKTFINRNGNLRINIENSILALQNNPAALLSKLPGVQVSSDEESISIIGKGQPLVYIDNRRATMNDVNSLAVDQIKSIDIINNPSARYEAEGRAVVLIRTKFNKDNGTKVNISQTSVYRKAYTNRAVVNVNHKKNKLELKTNLQYNQINNWERNSYDFRIVDKGISTGYDVSCITTRPQLILTSGMYYQINADDYLSVGNTFRIQTERFPINTISYLNKPGQNTSVVTANINRARRRFMSSNLNYQKTFQKINGQLFFGMQYSNFVREQTGMIFNRFNNAQEVLSQVRDQEGNINVANAKLDFEKTLKKDWKFESGLSFYTPFSKAYLATEEFNPPVSASSDYRYEEKVSAAYTQVSGKIKKAEISAGVRLENAQVSGGFKGTAVRLIDRNYTRFFPKASLSLPVDSSKVLTVSYSKTIKRPDYSSVSQVTQYINPYFEWSSNVNLQPSFAQEAALNLQYKNQSVRIAYTYGRSPVYADFLYDEPALRLTRKDVNFEKEEGLTITLTCPFEYRQWRTNTFIVAGKNRVSDRRANQFRSNSYLYFYSNHEFTLPRAYKVAVTASGITRRFEGIYERNAFFSVDTSFSKTFDNNLNLGVVVNNLFNSLKYQEAFTINNIEADGAFYAATDLSVSLRYSFGKGGSSKYRNKEIDESSGRIR